MLKEVSIEIIRKCPNHCVHCSSLSDERRPEILDYDRFTSVVLDAAKLGATTICLSGGEPFLHPRITDMIQYIASLGLQTYAYTSGIIFDHDQNRVSLNEELLEAISGNVTKLIFNIETANSSTYNKIMGTEGCFDKMKQSVLLAHQYSITTEAHFVPMKLNVDEINAVAGLCKELGISKLSFLRLVIHGRAIEYESQIALTLEELEELRGKLQTLKAEPGLDIRIGVPLATETSCHKCEAAKGKLNIRYDGTVFPCEVFKNGRVSMSLEGASPENIYDKPLFEIYRNSAYLNQVRNMSQKFECGKQCETCIGQYLINNGDGCGYEQ